MFLNTFTNVKMMLFGKGLAYRLADVLVDCLITILGIWMNIVVIGVEYKVEVCNVKVGDEGLEFGVEVEGKGLEDEDRVLVGMLLGCLCRMWVAGDGCKLGLEQVGMDVGRCCDVQAEVDFGMLLEVHVDMNQPQGLGKVPEKEFEVDMLLVELKIHLESDFDLNNGIQMYDFEVASLSYYNCCKKFRLIDSLRVLLV